MKQLKLQKTLLAICLALPIALTINKATNAMKESSDDNIITTQEQTSDIIDQHFDQFLVKENISKAFNSQQYNKLVTTYIGSNIVKYLTSMILANHGQFSNPQNKKQSQFVVENYLNQLIQGYSLDQQQRDTSNTNHATAEQISNIKNELIKLRKQTKETSPEVKILKLLLIPNSYEQGSSDFADELQTAVEDYQNATNATIDTNYPTLIKFLEPTEQLLQKTHQYRFQNLEGNPIEIIANNVRAFITTYKQRAQQQLRQEGLNANSEPESSQTITPLEAAQNQLINQVNHLTQQQNKDIDDKHKTLLILKIQQTLSKLHVERIKKLTSLKNKIEQRQLHQQHTTKHSLQVTQQLLDLFEQLNQRGLLGSISDDLEKPFAELAKATKQFTETRAKYKQTIDQHDNQIKTLSQRFEDLQKQLEKISKQQQIEGPEQASQIKQ